SDAVGSYTFTKYSPAGAMLVLNYNAPSEVAGSTNYVALSLYSYSTTEGTAYSAYYQIPGMPPFTESDSFRVLPTLTLTSTAFTEGGAIPQRYLFNDCGAQSGLDYSPPLAWTAPPDGTQSFALLADDPDAPGAVWTHWVLFNLPADIRSLAETVGHADTLANTALQGQNDFGNLGYDGPCVPSGTHRYFFKLYALDTVLTLPSGANRSSVEDAMSGHILAQGQLMGRSSR
ncbi:MAG: YbhB/YbcL family Raf kinase inhibitor-like protein, partial [Verrucomicrobia bacterium]|nr:YbhB/YbcL family Raf kinase inhibitor-like protein [Verrucomicrobiota bacterium]